QIIGEHIAIGKDVVPGPVTHRRPQHGRKIVAGGIVVERRQIGREKLNAGTGLAFTRIELTIVVGVHEGEPLQEGTLCRDATTFEHFALRYRWAARLPISQEAARPAPAARKPSTQRKEREGVHDCLSKIEDVWMEFQRRYTRTLDLSKLRSIRI